MQVQSSFRGPICLIRPLIGSQSVKRRCTRHDDGHQRDNEPGNLHAADRTGPSIDVTGVLVRAIAPRRFAEHPAACAIPRATRHTERHRFP